MPCDSSYMGPTGKEKRLQETAQLLRWVYTKQGFVIPRDLKEAATNIYCKTDYVAELCEVLRLMRPEKRDQMIYGNSRDKMARRLADWWEEHQTADIIRRVKEAEAQIRESQRQQVLAKLTPEERELLGID